MLVHFQDKEPYLVFDKGTWRLVSAQHPGDLDYLPKNPFPPEYGDFIGLRNSTTNKTSRLAVFKNQKIDQDLSDSMDWFSNRWDFIYQVRVKLKGGVLRSSLGFDPVSADVLSVLNILDMIQALVNYGNPSKHPSFKYDIEFIEIVAAINLYEIYYPFRKEGRLFQSYGYFKINQRAALLAQAISKLLKNTPVLARMVYSSNYNVVEIYRDGVSDCR